MSRALQSRRAVRAFTLIELLLATAIGSIVLLVINATFFSALRLHNTTHERIDHDLVLQRTLGIVRKDLSGIALPGTGTNTLRGPLTTETFSSTAMDGTGQRISPDIYTNSGRVDGWNSFSEMQSVAYYLAPATDGSSNKNLVRSVTRNLLSVTEPATDDQTLLTGVTSAEMSFYDGSDWTDTWDSATSSTLPSAIKFSVVLAPRENSGVRFASGPVEIVVPIMVTTSTSAQLAAAAESGQ